MSHKLLQIFSNRSINSYHRTKWLLSPSKNPPKKKISSGIIELLSKILPSHYNTNSFCKIYLPLADYLKFPIDEQSTTKEIVENWLHAINVTHDKPLEILGQILKEFMSKEYYIKDDNDSEAQQNAEQLQRDRKQILKALMKSGLKYN
ncbi:hypothetical protein [Bartonella rattaustraliani]|uniref:hypothetical protein n=1 Tax=Bartonella rattaustraliani TaxID=481139 RepID=UPI00037F5609|nr:hypothetical protein [Bartonella rattaustraliani]